MVPKLPENVELTPNTWTLARHFYFLFDIYGNLHVMSVKAKNYLFNMSDGGWL